MTASPLPPSAQRPVTLEARLEQNDFSALSALLLKTLSKACGEDRPSAPASLGVEFAAVAFASQPVAALAVIQRSTRTLLFVSAEARDASGARLAIASGVFKIGD